METHHYMAGEGRWGSPPPAFQAPCLRGGVLERALIAGWRGLEGGGSSLGAWSGEYHATSRPGSGALAIRPPATCKAGSRRCDAPEPKKPNLFESQYNTSNIHHSSSYNTPRKRKPIVHLIAIQGRERFESQKREDSELYFELS